MICPARSRRGQEEARVIGPAVFPEVDVGRDVHAVLTAFVRYGADPAVIRIKEVFRGIPAFVLCEERRELHLREKEEIAPSCLIGKG